MCVCVCVFVLGQGCIPRRDNVNVTEGMRDLFVGWYPCRPCHPQSSSLRVFVYGRHTAAVAIAVAAATPTRLAVAVFTPDVLSVVTVPLET